MSHSVAVRAFAVAGGVFSWRVFSDDDAAGG